MCNSLGFGHCCEQKQTKLVKKKTRNETRWRQILVLNLLINCVK